MSVDKTELIESTTTTDCCIVGGGPAGVILSLLLARQGIKVTLLEEHKNFERDFRGDTVHPSTMEIMDELGLADRLLTLRHTKIHEATVTTDTASVVVANLRNLKTRFPYITILPQAIFLDFITKEAQQYPNFTLIMGARVEKLIEENGQVQGVRYRGEQGWHEVHATLTVGTDGRFSRIRKLAGYEPIKTSPPMDVLWFNLPHKETDPETMGVGRIVAGSILVMFDRHDYWQVGLIILKGSYKKLREDGLAAFQQIIAKTLPDFADRVDSLQDWKQVSLLSVESSILKRWYKPGLLLLGDAAHVMSPIGGVGINYAIQDAVVASNVLSEPLLAGHVETEHLAQVQRQREWPVRIIQFLQSVAQRQVIARALNPNAKPIPKIILKIISWLRTISFVRDLPARVVAFGVWRVHLKAVKKTKESSLRL